MNDDHCDYSPWLQYYVPTSIAYCREYQLDVGCYSYSSCSVTVEGSVQQGYNNTTVNPNLVNSSSVAIVMSGSITVIVPQNGERRLQAGYKPRERSLQPTVGCRQLLSRIISRLMKVPLHAVNFVKVSVSSSRIIIPYHHQIQSSPIIISYHHPVSSSHIIIPYHHPVSSSLSLIHISEPTRPY